MIAISVKLAACAAACAGLVTLMTSPAHAQSSSPVRADMPIDALKTLYLGCERSAVSGTLDAGSVMQCSIAYEELKRRAFGGDFKSMKRWSDAQFRLREVIG